MTKHARRLAPTALAVLTTVCAPTAFAQQDPQQPDAQPEAQRREARLAQAEAQRGQAQAQRAQAQAQRAQAQGDQSDVQRELQKAREQLQEAAREVARLSAELVGPVVKDVTRQFRYSTHRGMLGLAIEDTELGVRVTGVTPNGAGAEAGVLVGDTIVAIDGAELAAPPAAGAKRQSPSQLLMAQLNNVKAGDDVELRVMRNGDYRTVHAKAREASWDVFANGNFPNMNFTGVPGPWPDGFWRQNAWSDLQLATLNPGLGEYFGTKEGLLVVRAPKDSTIGLKDGDVILEIAGRKPTSPEHAMRILASFEPGETLRLSVMRHQKRETVEGKVPAAPAH